MRLVACDNSAKFFDWLKCHEYPSLETDWGLGLLDGCYKYFAMGPAKPNRRIAGELPVGAVWYHWWDKETLSVHLCADLRLVIDRQLIGDFYKAPELLGAKYLRAIIDDADIEEFARRAGWGTKPGETIYETSLPSRWSRYDVKGEDHGRNIRRRPTGSERSIEAPGSTDRGGPGQGEGRREGPRRPSSGEKQTAQARPGA